MKEQDICYVILKELTEKLNNSSNVIQKINAQIKMLKSLKQNVSFLIKKIN